MLVYTFSNGIKLRKNSGNGKKVAFHLPTSMDGATFTKFLKSNEAEIVSAKASLLGEDSEEGDRFARGFRHA